MPRVAARISREPASSELSRPSYSPRVGSLLGALALLALCGTGLHAQPPVEDPELRRIMSEMRPQIERNAGPLAKPVRITSDPAYQDRVLGLDRGVRSARTIPAFQAESGWYEDAGSGCGIRGCPNEMEVCLIVVTDRGIGEGAAQLRHTVAHEIYHCVQYERGGFRYQLPAWLQEGSAVWAALEVANNSVKANQHWTPYFTETASLFDLEYEGVGVFGHLDSRGVDVWGVLNTVYRETADTVRDVPEMLDFLLGFAGDPASLLRTWPMGMERNPAAGPDWDTTAPVPARRPAASITAPTQKPVSRATQYLYDMTVPSGKVITIGVSDAYGAIRWGNETTEIAPDFKREYCVRGTCQCEDGTTPPGIEEVDGSSAIVALTGYLGGGRFSATESDPPCEDKLACSGTGSFDSCLVGTWNLDIGSAAAAVDDPVTGSLAVTFDETGGVRAVYDLRYSFGPKRASYTEQRGSAQGCARGTPGQFSVPGVQFGDDNVHRDYDAQDGRYYNLPFTETQMIASRTFSYVCEERQLFVWGLFRFDRTSG